MTIAPFPESDPGVLQAASEVAPVRRFLAPGGIDFESAAFERFCAGAGDLAEVLVWSQSRCLVTSRAVSQRTRFEDASQASARRGWPVHVRRSGGSTVFHGEGTLCLSLMFTCKVGDLSIDGMYARLVRPLLDAFSMLGVVASAGAAPRAPCDGRFNILVDDRKLAGTAVRARSRDGRAFILAHAVILMSDSALAGLEAVQQFEHGLGLATEYKPASCICLSQALGGHFDEASMSSVLERAFRRTLADQPPAMPLAAEIRV